MLRYIYNPTASADRTEALEILHADTDMFTQALAMALLCKNHGYTQAGLAKELGVSQSTIGNKIRLLQFTPAQKQQILQYNLTERHARALLSAPPQRREKLIQTVATLKLNVRQTEELVESNASSPELAQFNVVQANTIADFSIDRFIMQTTAGVDRMRAYGTKVAFVNEQGVGWRRLTITIKDDCFT